MTTAIELGASFFLPLPPHARMHTAVQTDGSHRLEIASYSFFQRAFSWMPALQEERAWQELHTALTRLVDDYGNLTNIDVAARGKITSWSQDEKAQFTTNVTELTHLYNQQHSSTAHNALFYIALKLYNTWLRLRGKDAISPLQPALDEEAVAKTVNHLLLIQPLSPEESILLPPSFSIRDSSAVLALDLPFSPEDAKLSFANETSRWTQARDDLSTLSLQKPSLSENETLLFKREMAAQIQSLSPQQRTLLKEKLLLLATLCNELISDSNPIDLSSLQQSLRSCDEIKRPSHTLAITSQAGGESKELLAVMERFSKDPTADGSFSLWGQLFRIQYEQESNQFSLQLVACDPGKEAKLNLYLPQANTRDWETAPCSSLSKEGDTLFLRTGAQRIELCTNPPTTKLSFRLTIRQSSKE